MESDRALSGKLAFVTGGASGIGLGIATAFANAGMKVVVADLAEDRLRGAVELLRANGSPDAHAIELDVADRGAVGRAAEEVTKIFGNVHVLCNSAGVNELRPMDEATFEDWDWIMGVNFSGVVNCVVHFVPRIKAGGEGGHIVNVASMASFIPSVRAGVYATSKAAVRGLTESLRLSLGPFGIGVSLVSPGLTRTNIWQSPLLRVRAGRGGKVDEQTLNRLREPHACGMDPFEVGRKTLLGMLRNDLYVFTHPEFAEELAEINDEVLAALPREDADGQRVMLERQRREAKTLARQLSNSAGCAAAQRPTSCQEPPRRRG
jgi:NAD(P)-dependent dehydrogenase (short-subunit alcohol dehydrogenase family)